MTPALILAVTLMASSAPDSGGEPLPPGAPTDPYELSAWCYGALGEYLVVYDRVKPDLIDIDRMFGTSVVEAEPYQADMAAARQELKVIGDAVTAAEKASPRPIAPVGAAAMQQGAAIWSVMEGKTRRELARAWLSWALPDRCDTVSRDLAARSALLGKALTYNNGPADQAPAAEASPAATPPPAPAEQPAADAAPPPAQPEPQAAIATPQPAPQPETQAAAPPPAAAPPVAQEAAPEPQPAAPTPEPAATEAAPAEQPPRPAPLPAQSPPPQQPEAAPSDQSQEPTL